MGGQIADAAGQAGAAAEMIDSVEEARTRLPKMLKRGDVVLLKGSRAVQMERLVDPIRSAFEKPRRARAPRAASTRKRKSGK
jgi:UDP-N-acetylmuramyl pentapeptide synthase